jgi:hypothetical protein
MRVQDRATSRIRRLANDLGGMERASELQRRGARLAADHNKLAVQQARTVAAETARTSAVGEKMLGNQAKMLRFRAQELQLADRLSRMKPGTAQLATTMRLQAVRKEILRLTELEKFENAQITAQKAEQLALQKAIEREMVANEAALARAVSRERAVTRARTAIHAGGAAAMIGGIGLVAAGGASSEFAEFNRDAVNAATQMRGVNESFEATVKISGTLQAHILDLTRKFPASANEMANSIYDIASGMDVQIDRSSTLTETQQRYVASSKLLVAANKVAVAGQLDLEDATNSLIGVFNNFDPMVKRQNQVLNELFAIVRFGKGSFAEFAPVFGRMAAAANAAGQTLVEAGGAVAFLSQRLSQSQAVTAYTRLMQIMSRKEFRVGFEDIFNISATTGKGAAEKLRQLSDIIGIMVTQMPSLKKGGVTLQTLIQTITARGQDLITGRPGHVGIQATENARVGVVNLAKGVDNYRQTLANIRGDQTEFNDALAAMMQTPGVQWQIATNQFKAFAIVLGQSVIPVMLRFMDWVTALFHRFQDLDPRTRNIIGQFAAWGSIALFLGGALAALIGSIGLIIAKLGGLGKLLGFGASGVGIVGRFGQLFLLLKKLSIIGAIAIVIKTAWTGDASAKDFLMGALSGAAAGFAVGGPIGALVGGITVPVVMAVTAKSDPGKVQQNMAAMAALGRGSKSSGARNAEKDRQAGMNVFTNKQNFKDLDKKFGFGAFVAAQKARLNELKKENNAGAQSILERWQQLAGELTGVDIFSGMTQKAAMAAAQMGLSLAKAMATGNEAKIRAALQAGIKFDQGQIAKLEKLPKTADNIKKLTILYTDLAQKQQQITTMDKAATAETKRSNREHERHQKELERTAKALDKAQQKVQTLKLKMKGLREEMQDKLRAAFGQVFGGPLMQGPIGGMFQNISSMLSGVGQSFAIPADFILKDQAAQQKQFDMLMGDLDFLSKRGVGPKVIQDILSQGTAALPMLEGIRKGTPAQQKQFIDNLKNANSAISKAMQSPWQKQINASNIQLKAAQMQLKAAQANVKDKKGDVKKVKPPTTGAGTRKETSVVHHGDQVTIHADGATPRAVQAALNRTSYNKRNRK